MRLIGNPRLGQLAYAPVPLEICPGRQVWERYRNREYLVFLDESFYRFFGFGDVTGNLSHAAVGIPAENYPRLRQGLGPLIRAYSETARRETGQQPEEIKFSVLHRLPRRLRLRLARELVAELAALGGFVAGFYAPTKGLIMEHVRTSLPSQLEEVPADHAELYERARLELLAQLRGPGQAALITKLLYRPFSAFSAFLSSFQCTFRILYDPRQGSEDQWVSEALTEYMGNLTRVPDLFGHDPSFRGMQADACSHEELGLQLADVVAGEVRDFFRNNGDALDESATLRLITTDSNEPLQRFITMHGRTFKAGALIPMSRNLRRKFRPRNATHVISYYYPVLAAGMLSCTTNTGQCRDIEIPTGTLSDALD